MGCIADKRKFGGTLRSNLMYFFRINIDISDFCIDSKSHFIGNAVIPSDADGKEKIIGLDDFIGIRCTKHTQQAHAKRIVFIHNAFCHERVDGRNVKKGVKFSYGAASLW